MAQITYKALLQAFKSKQYAPIYFLQGDEPYYINRLVHYIENEILPPHAKSFDFTTLYGQDTSLQEILLRAKRFPMIASKQVVLVKEAQMLKDLDQPSAQKYLLHYLDHPNKETILFFSYQNKTLDQRKTFTKKLIEKATFFTANKIYEKQLPSWLQDHVQTKGYQITPEAIHICLTLVGEQLEILAKEIEKITANLPKGTTITLPIVNKYVSQSKKFNIFDLQQAIQKRHIERIWEVTYHFTQDKKKYPLLPQITLLSNFFTKLLLLHQKPNSTLAQIAFQLKIPPYFAKDYQKALTNYTRKKVIENLQYLHQADLQVKSIAYPVISESIILKTLIAKLISS